MKVYFVLPAIGGPDARRRRAEGLLPPPLRRGERDARARLYRGNTIETSLGTFGSLLEGFARHSNGFERIDGAPNLTDRGDTGFTLAEPMRKLSWAPRSEREQRFEFKFGYTKIDADETYLGLSESDFDDDPFRRYAATRFDNFEASHFRTYLRHFLDAGWGVDLTTTIDMSLSSALASANRGFGLDVVKGERAGTLRVRNNDRESAASASSRRVSASPTTSRPSGCCSAASTT